VIRYILSTRDDLTIDDLKEVVEEIIPERSGFIMNLADRLKEEGKRGELIETGYRGP
jgi:hypothetical protein